MQKIRNSKARERVGGIMENRETMVDLRVKIERSLFAVRWMVEELASQNDASWSRRRWEKLLAVIATTIAPDMGRLCLRPWPHQGWDEKPVNIVLQRPVLDERRTMNSALVDMVVVATTVRRRPSIFIVSNCWASEGDPVSRRLSRVGAGVDLPLGTRATMN